MADKSKIEWLNGGSTWNPIRAELLEDIIDPETKEILHHAGEIGWFCIRKSPGCKGCYACRMNLWRGNGLDYSVPNLSKVRIFLDEKTLLQPLRWRAPRLIFPCSMTDWMDDFVPLDFRDKMLAVMALTPRHTYLTLTKEAGNQQKYFTRFGDSIEGWAQALCNTLDHEGNPFWEEEVDCAIHNSLYGNLGEGLNVGWPMRNLWLGTSAESQPYADSRIPQLLSTPASVRWVSCEPLLGPIDLTRIAVKLANPRYDLGDPTHASALFDHAGDTAKLDWVVAGGESGPNARPMHPDWARSLRDQCQAAGVPFFFKQHGEWMPIFHGINPSKNDPKCRIHAGFTFPPQLGDPEQDGRPIGQHMWKVGKKAAGRLLDGKEHSEYPEVRS